MNKLMSLPGELRNRIYEMVLIEGLEEQEFVELEQSGADCPFRRMKSYRPGPSHPRPLDITGLPLTCKTLRRESLRLYYSLNKFYFQTEYLRSNEKSQVIERIESWVNQVGPEQASEIRDVTISLASLKGQAAPCGIYWPHICRLRSLFHPKGLFRIKFCLTGNGTATFTLGKRSIVWRQLESMEDGWLWVWKNVRRMSETEAMVLASIYRREIERLFEGMPEEL